MCRDLCQSYFCVNVAGERPRIETAAPQELTFESGALQCSPDALLCAARNHAHAEAEGRVYVSNQRR